jgi:ABC-2 type transport system permease protein
MKTNFSLQAVLSTAWKDLQIIFRDRGFLVIVLGLPLVFSVMFGSIYSRMGQANQEGVTFPVVLVNQDQGVFGRQIASILESVSVLEVTPLDSLEAARQQVIDSQALAAILIPPNLTEQVNAYQPSEIEVLIDPTQEQMASIITGIMKEVVSPVVVQGEIAYGIRSILADTTLFQQADDKTRGALAAQSMAVEMAQVHRMQSAPWIAVKTRTQSGKDLVVLPSNVFALIVPSFTVLFAFFVVGAMAKELLKEKHQGTLRRLVSAPVHRTTLVAGKMLAYLVVVLVQVLLLFGACNLVFDMPLGNSFFGLVLVSLCLGLAVTGMGMLLASLFKSDRQADTAGTVLGFLLGGLGGCFFMGSVPLYKSGGTIELVSKLTPQAHALLAFDTLLNQGGGVIEALPQALILLGFAAVFFVVAAWRFRYE